MFKTVSEIYKLSENEQLNELFLLNDVYLKNINNAINYKKIYL